MGDDFEQDCSEQSNDELSEVKLLDDKQDIRPINDIDSSEEFLSERMNVNHKDEQALELDVSDLVEENGEFSKDGISALRNYFEIIRRRN